MFLKRLFLVKKGVKHRPASQPKKIFNILAGYSICLICFNGLRANNVEDILTILFMVGSVPKFHYEPKYGNSFIRISFNLIPCTMYKNQKQLENKQKTKLNKSKYKPRTAKTQLHMHRIPPFSQISQNTVKCKKGYRSKWLKFQKTAVFSFQLDWRSK